METFKLLSVLLLLQVCGNVFGIETYYLTDHCNTTLNINVTNQIRIRSKNFETHNYSTECRVAVSAALTSKMMVYFKTLNIVDSVDCDKGNVNLYDGSFGYFESSNSTLIAKLCGSSTPTTIYETTDDILTIGYQSWTSSSPEFDIIVTQYHAGNCYSYETKCSNGKCIDDHIACNGFNPCGDESDCPASTIAISIGASSGGGVFVIILICFCYVKRRNIGPACKECSKYESKSTQRRSWMQRRS